VFDGLPNPFTATRYHALIVDRGTVSADFEISAWTEQDEIMGLRWVGPGSERAPMEGVQFHPESFLTTSGPMLLANFLGLPAPPIPAGAGDLERARAPSRRDAMIRRSVP
jgi:anthranilate/para-aminobenzoate synthase component II